MGLMFGTIFGIMDMEEISLRYIKEMLVKEENYCIPIGVVCGAMMGLFSSFIDNNENTSEQSSSKNPEGFQLIKQEDEVEI